MEPEICTTPSSAVMDEKIEIFVKNLAPNAPVTVDNYIYHSHHLFHAFGHFYSRPDGTVKVEAEVSHGGSYTGVLPMGLFTSMQPLPTKRAGGHLLVKESANETLKFSISVWKGHKSRDELHRLRTTYAAFGTLRNMPEHLKPLGYFFDDNFLCSTSVERTYLQSGVKRREISEWKNGVPIRGVFFVPPGPGPFPGLIDCEVMGGRGGCLEFRAALLAKQGFATLALGFVNYKDMPYRSIFEVPPDYFDHAIDWILSRPEVSKAPGGIGLIGAQFALLSAIRSEKIVAAVCMNWPAVVRSDPNQDLDLQTSKRLDFSQIFYPREGMREVWNGRIVKRGGGGIRLPRPLLEYKHDNPILMIRGENDTLVYGEQLEEIVEQLKKSGKTRVFQEIIPGEGHLIEPPYSPLCLECPTYSAIGSDYGGNLMYCGGELKGHEQNQMRAWNIVLNFLKENIIGRSCKMCSKI